MFGYIRTDTPYLYIKDQTLYQALYCGVCKGIGKTCGHAARMGLSYDVTFLSALLHNLAGVDIRVETQHCLTHCIRTKKMAVVDELSMQLGALNTALVYYKYTDDIQDGDKGRGKRLWFAHGFKKMKRKYPEIEKIVRENLAKQEQIEKQRLDSIDRSADATANMLRAFSVYVLKEKSTEDTEKLFYAIGKWIYLIDALDDYDKDVKKGAYNPFVQYYRAPSKQTLMRSEQGKEVQYVFNALFFDIREGLSKVKFHFNRDLTDNILLRGLPKTTGEIMRGCACKENRHRTKENADTK